MKRIRRKHFVCLALSIFIAIAAVPSYALADEASLEPPLNNLDINQAAIVQQIEDSNVTVTLSDPSTGESRNLDASSCTTKIDYIELNGEQITVGYSAEISGNIFASDDTNVSRLPKDDAMILKNSAGGYSSDSVAKVSGTATFTESGDKVNLTCVTATFTPLASYAYFSNRGVAYTVGAYNRDTFYPTTNSASKSVTWGYIAGGVAGGPARWVNVWCTVNLTGMSASQELSILFHF